MDLVNAASIVLSIVPPAEALRTAKRIAYTYTYAVPDGTTRYYVDLNATARSTSEKIEVVLKQPLGGVEPRYLDGAIFGLPPSQQGDSGVWKKPRIAVSGPWELHPHFEYTLGIRHVGPDIGQASTLKMCFSSLTKGLTALAVQSFTSAHAVGLLPQLREELTAFAPQFGQGMLGFLERNLSAVPPKAYRWIKEMEEISDTHATTGFDPDVFRSIAEVYRFVSEDTDIGVARQGGESVETMVSSVALGLERKSSGEAQQKPATREPTPEEEEFHSGDSMFMSG